MVRISSGLTAAICLAIGSAGVTHVAPAEEPAAETVPPAAAQPATAEIPRLIEQLDAPEFDVRERATKTLIDKGKTAIDALASAAPTVSLEAGTRCVAVLRKLRESADGETIEAAEAALRHLAECRNPSIARRAAEILRPPVRSTSRTSRPLNLAAGFAAVPAAQAIRISSRTTNGRTEMDITAGDTKISIAHSDGKEIVVKVSNSEDPKGKEPAVIEYKAKDVDELKEKHPEAYAHYMRYAPRTRTINIANIAAAARPVAEIPEETRLALEELQKSRSDMSRLYSRFSSLSRQPDLKPDDLQPVIDELKTLSDRIAEIQKKLPKQPKP